MIVFKPNRRVCEGQSVKYPVTSLDPFDWLQVNSKEYTSFCIDGFIVNNRKKINSVFNKYEFKREQTIEHILNDLKSNFSDEIFASTSFSKILNTQYRIFLWPKDYPEGYDLNEKLIIAVNPFIEEEKIILSKYRMVTISDLETGIRKLRGYSFKNVKPLLSANSNVECYLADKTRNPWPGDLDALLYLYSGNKVIALIEFKTHNKDTPIKDEYIGKYSNQDWRRFEVLYSLQNELEDNQDLRPKLFFIVWGTQNVENHKNLKIDIIENNKVLKTDYVKRPPFGQPSKMLFNLIIEQSQ